MCFFFTVLCSCAQIRGVRSRHTTVGVLRARHGTRGHIVHPPLTVITAIIVVVIVIIIVVIVTVIISVTITAFPKAQAA